MCKGDVQEDGTGPAKASGPKVEPGLVVSVGDTVLVGGYNRSDGTGVMWAADWIVAGFALEGDGVLLRSTDRQREGGDRRDSWVLRSSIVGIVARGNPATFTSIRVA